MDSHTPHKTELRFSVAGLPAREELLFKSMVRLLSHRTVQIWLYSPEAAQLLVCSEGHALQSQVPYVLTLGVAAAVREAYLMLPLRADELERELNRLGALIAHSGQSRLAHTPQTTAAPIERSAANTAWRMTRWPPAQILAAPGRMHLATLMTGKPATLAWLQQHSGQTLANCQAFIDELQQASLLTPHAPAGHSGANQSTSRPAALHANSAPAPVPADTAAGLSSSPVALNSMHANPGLLARIRSRLGLSFNTTRSA